MTTDPRHRRTVFDDAAELYDAARPTYPSALFADLVTLANLPPGGHVLEVGCGTGQATVPLARRGYRVLAIELGAHLAAVARRNLAAFPLAEVVVGNFEEWPLDAGAFDLVVAATAFHWIDPATRYARAAQALRPGGALALFHTHHVKVDRDGGFFQAAQEVYLRVLGESARAYRGLPRPNEVGDDEADRIASSGLFGPVATRRYLWEVGYDATTYLNLLNTYSDHRGLDPSTRQRLFDGLAAVINTAFGGRIVKGYLAPLAVARRQ